MRRAHDDHDADDILSDLLRARDEGEEPNVERWLGRYPGREGSVRIALRRLSEYDEFESLARGENRALSPGRCLGDFEVMDCLGRGGMGIVFRAKQRSLGGRVVALKVLPASLATADSRARFEGEARLLAQLPRSPCLAEVFGYGEQDGWLFYAMSLIPGRTLHDVLNGLARGYDRSGVRERITDWALDVAEALSVVHRAELVHRDVKPSNIVVDHAGSDSPVPLGRAVLVDFGLVQRVDVRTQGSSWATRPYASPEQVRGEPLTTASDVYSMGMTVLDLLLGQMPEQRPPVHERLSLLQAASEPDLAAILTKATAAEAVDRYRDGEALLADLRASRAGARISARHWSRQETLSRYVDRHAQTLSRFAFGVVIVALLSLTASTLGNWLTSAIRARRDHHSGRLVQFISRLSHVPEVVQRVVLTSAMLEDSRLPDVIDTAEAAKAGVDAGVRVALNALLDHPTSPLLVSFINREFESATESGDIETSHRLLREAAAALSLELQPRNDLATLHALLIRIADAPGQDQGPARLTRLLALSAAIGCGTPADLPQLLHRATAGNLPAEERRLLVWSMHEIVINAHRDAALDGIDLEAIITYAWTVLREARSRWIRGDAGSAWGLMSAATELIRAAAFAADDASIPLPTLEVPEFEELWIGSWRHAEHALLALSSLRDPRILRLLKPGQVFCRDGAGDVSPSPRALARILGCFGDEVRAATLPRVSAYLVATRDEWGEDHNLEGASEAPAVQREVLHGFRNVDEERCAVRQRQAVGRGAEAAVDDRRRDAPGAEWRFTTYPAQRRNGLRSEPAVLVGGAQILVDEQGAPYFALRRGDDAVEFPFTVGDGDPVATYVVQMECLPSIQPHLPYGGEAGYELLLDGERIATNLTRSVLDRRQDTIPQRFLQPGRHVLVVRAGPHSTTNLRIYTLVVGSP